MTAPVKTHMARAMAALARIRTALANAMSGGEVEAAQRAAAEAQEARDAERREKEEIVAAVEAFADEIAPPAPDPTPVEVEPTAEAEAETQEETQEAE